MSCWSTAGELAVSATMPTTDTTTATAVAAAAAALAAGARCDMLDADGRGAWDYATERGDKQIKALLEANGFRPDLS